MSLAGIPDVPQTGLLPSHPFQAETGRQVMFQTQFNGLPTNIIVTTYVDTVFILVTQNNRLGTLLSGVRDKPVSTTGVGEGTVTVTTLLGRRDDIMYVALARRLTRLITDIVDKKLLLALSFAAPAKSAAAAAPAPTAADATAARVVEAATDAAEGKADAGYATVGATAPAVTVPAPTAEPTSAEEAAKKAAYTQLFTEIVEKGFAQFKVPAQ